MPLMPHHSTVRVHSDPQQMPASRSNLLLPWDYLDEGPIQPVRFGVLLKAVSIKTVAQPIQHDPYYVLRIQQSGSCESCTRRCPLAHPIPKFSSLGRTWTPLHASLKPDSYHTGCMRRIIGGNFSREGEDRSSSRRPCGLVECTLRARGADLVIGVCCGPRPQQ